jgi:Xaa-Pro dipeptidase
VHALFLSHSLTHRAKQQSYPIIAASGPNASTLHYTDNDQPLAGRQLLLLDAGAEYACYASDVTRTLPLSRDGRFSREAAAVYRVVERMQEECISFVRPGVAFYCLHLHAAGVAVRELLGLGILCGGSAYEILCQGTIAAIFPHGLGHHVGLEVLDVTGGEWLLPAAAVLGLEGVEEEGRAAAMVGKREVVGPAQMAGMYGVVLGLMRNGGDVVEGRVRVGGGQKLEKGMVVTIEPGM